MEKEPIDWQSWRCRCSGINSMMANSKDNAPLTEKQVVELADLDKKSVLTGPQTIRRTELILKREKSKEVVLGDTCVQFLLEAFAWETEKMCSITKEMDVESFERGRKTEPESIELLSFVDDIPYVKNETRFDNDFLTGIPDVLEVKEMIGAEGPVFYASSIVDIKSCRDYPLFLYKIHKGLDSGNREQVAGYGDILECSDLGVAFTLPTMPASIREGYKMKLAYKMEAVTNESPEFKKAWADLERSMIFNHMPQASRVYKVPVDPFTPSEQQAVYDKVKICREWLANFHEKYQKLNK